MALILAGFDELRAFFEVAKAGNLTTAAQMLGVSQPAVSYRIRLLEQRLGKGLFLRKKTGMALNAFGQEFLSICGKLSQDIAAIDNWIKGQQGYMGGRLHISAISGVMNYILSDFLTKFIAQHPEVKFVIEENISALCEEKILNGSHDVGIIAGKCRKNSLKAKLLFINNGVMMVCTPAYAQKLGKRLHAKILKPDDILWYANTQSRGRTSREIAKHLGIRNVDNACKICLPDMETCKIYALKGLGVAVVARMLVHEEIKAGRLVVVPGFSMKIPIYLISRNEAYQSPVLTRFKQDFSDYCVALNKEWAKAG